MTEDEMVGWHHRLNGHEFEQAPGVGGWGKPDMLQSMEPQTVRHQRVTELTNQINDILKSLTEVSMFHKVIVVNIF